MELFQQFHTFVHVRERRGVYRVLVGKSEGKGPLGRPSSRWAVIEPKGNKVNFINFTLQIAVCES